MWYLPINTIVETYGNEEAFLTFTYIVSVGYHALQGEKTINVMLTLSTIAEICQRGYFLNIHRR